MYSKSTKFLELPQWTPTDHPDFLTDMNTAMKKLDNQAEKTDHDHSDLREQVNALSEDMVTVKEQVDALQVKVDNLVNLEDNPVFIALKEHVDTLQETVDGIIQTDNRQDLDIQQLQAAITRIDDTIGIIENHLQQHDSHFDIHDKELSDIKANILHIENDVDDLRTHVAHMEGSVAQMETEVGHIKGEQITQNDRLDALETAKTEQDTKIADIETKVEEQNTKISTIEQTANTADETADAALEEAMKAVSTANGTSAETEVLTQGLADMKDRVDGIDERVTNNTTSIGNLNTMYEALDGRMDTLEQSDTKQNADILRAETKADTALDTAEGLSTTVTGVESRITVLETDNSALNTRLTTAEEDIQVLKDRPSGGGDVTSEEFDGLEARVTTAENSITLVSERITNVESGLSGLEEQVVTASQLVLIAKPDVPYTEGEIDIEVNDFDYLVIASKITTETNSNIQYTDFFLAEPDIYTILQSNIDGITSFSRILHLNNGKLNFGVGRINNSDNNSVFPIVAIYGMKKASSTALSEAVVARVDALENTTDKITTPLIVIPSERILSTNGECSMRVCIAIDTVRKLIYITAFGLENPIALTASGNYNISLKEKIVNAIGKNVKITFPKDQQYSQVPYTTIATDVTVSPITYNDIGFKIYAKKAFTQMYVFNADAYREILVYEEV